MKKLRFFFIQFAFLLLFTGFSEAHAQEVVVLNINTPIYNATASYIQDGLEKALSENASCVILKINTPGGLLKPTRAIIGDIMNSPIPVISFVAPAGAHAGSAGSFIALSANLAVMASGTNIGAAHPVVSGGKIPDSVMNAKITNDATALIQSIAEKRGRNAHLLMEMVTNSRSFSAKQALDSQIIDFTADNLPELLKKLDNQTIQLNSGEKIVLKTSTAQVKNIEISSRDQFLNTLNNPDVMYILLLIGILGILFEIFQPGSLFPGIVGAICLILGAFGMTLLPVNYTGLALILLAMVLFLLEIKFASYGVLTISGATSLFLGSIFLIKGGASFDVITLSWTVIITSIIVIALFFIFIIGLGLKAQFSKSTTGKKGMQGKKGIAIEDLSPTGRVKLDGEFWQAATRGETIKANSPIEVIEIKGLLLIIKSLPLDL